MYVACLLFLVANSQRPLQAMTLKLQSAPGQTDLVGAPVYLAAGQVSEAATVAVTVQRFGQLLSL